MAVRNDIVVDFNVSPRIITVLAPSVELTVQDLHDTCSDLIDEPGTMSYEPLLRSEGKASLGGSVFVGITTTLLNAKVAFQSRKTFASTGTATSTDATGKTLTDTAATFIADGVAPGSWLLDLTSGAVATVLRVKSETVLETDLVLGGITLGDSYEIQNVTQCEISGGNLVALDSFGAPTSAVLNTAGTQIVRTSSSSATLQELQDIQYSSFGNGVTVDETSTYSGTAFPVGTPRQPVNNMSDALDIANARGFTTLFVIGDATIVSGLDYTGKVFFGESKTKTTLTLDPAAQVTNCEFYEATVTGTLDGGALLKNCRIQTLNYVDGFIEQCVLEGTITLGGDAHLLDCWSGVPGAGTPILDFDGTASALALRNYNGGITLRNKSGAEPVSADMSSGHVILENTVTAGTLTIRGVGKLTDNSAGATVDAADLLSPASVAEAVGALVVEGTITVEQSLRLMSAVLGGKVSGAGSGTETFRDLADTKDRAVFTVDAQGNRTVVVRDLTP